MSWFSVEKMSCPACGREFEGGTADSINVTRMPWAREQILAGHFHRVECPHCHAQSTIDRSFLYSDMTRGHFILVLPDAEIGRWPEREDTARDAFEQAIGNGPPLVREMARRFVVRCVFGLKDLGDKLRVWEAGLDDALVELLKLELMVRTPTLARRADLRLSVDVVAEAAGRLEVEAWSHDGSHAPSAWGAPLARYHELAAHRSALRESYPGLFTKPFVSFRRLAREVLSPETTP